MSVVDKCLYEIERLKEQRDRAVAQRAAMEGALWRAEWLLKRVVDGKRIDVAEIEAFILEPRHHPWTPGEAVTAQGEGAGAVSPGTGEVGHVDV